MPGLPRGYGLFVDWQPVRELDGVGPGLRTNHWAFRSTVPNRTMMTRHCQNRSNPEEVHS